MKRHRRTKQRTFRRPLREDELAKYLGALKNDTEKVVVRTLLQTGLRVSEFARLSPAVLDRKHQTITVLDGKGSKDRVVPVPHEALDRLERWFARREGTLGLSVPGIQYICYRLSQRAGLGARRVSPHILRHTYAVHALQKGATLAALQEVLGHDSMETTFIYLAIFASFMASAGLTDFSRGGWDTVNTWTTSGYLSMSRSLMSRSTIARFLASISPRTAGSSLL